MVFFNSRSCVGLELDTGAARVVELGGTAVDARLAALGGIVLPPGAVEEGMVLKPEEVGRALKSLWSARGIRGREVLLGVANQGVLVRYATVPKVPPDKLDNVVRFHAQEHLPIPLAGVVLDFMVIGETTIDSGEAYEILLVAARRDMLDGFLAALKFADLEPKDIDVSSLVLLRLLPPSVSAMTVAAINLGNGLSHILITAGGAPRLARLVPVKLKDLADKVNCPLESLLPVLNNPDEAVKGFLEEWMENLAAEIRSSINYYQGQDGAAEVMEIYLNGRGGRLPYIFERLEQMLDLPVRKINPLEKFITPAFKQLARHSEAMEYAICAGLAHRGLGG